MRAELLRFPNESVHSFRIRQDWLPNVNNRWHYHPESELIYIHKGEGTLFVGDSINRFGPGTLVLVGKNLPHFWRFDDSAVLRQVDDTPYCTVIHFDEGFWSEQFVRLPENFLLRVLVEKSKRGLQFKLNGNEQGILFLMEALFVAEGIKRIILLLEILLLIGSAPEQKALSSAGFKADYDEPDNIRLNLIYDYSFKNFRNKICLNEIARVSNMTPNAFCRYFKIKTRMTYSNFMTEIRVGYACKLLIENKLNVKQVCFESGFKNFSSFHSSFKSVTGKSPLIYQHEFLRVAV